MERSNLPADENEVRALYQALLDGRNGRNADTIAALFSEDGNLVGFDGSPLNGRAEMAEALTQELRQLL